MTSAPTNAPKSPPHLVDTHIHLDDLDGWQAQVDEAVEAGVRTLIAMGVDAASSGAALAMAGEHGQVWAAVGHHPLNQSPPDLQAIRELAADPRAVAIGEVGLDRSQDEHAGPWPDQLDWFHDLCVLALDLGLPVCVHIRETAQEVHDALAAHPGLTGVIHYWSLDAEWARRFLDLGFHVSFAGTVTRATKPHIREVAALVPDDRFLLETDAPWGTPRGRSGPMRPAWMVDTALAVAEARGWTLERLAEAERANVRALFKKIRL